MYAFARKTGNKEIYCVFDDTKTHVVQMVENIEKATMFKNSQEFLTAYVKRCLAFPNVRQDIMKETYLVEVVAETVVVKYKTQAI